jgi:hypothetical protein
MHAALGIEQLVLGLLIVGFREINLIGLPFKPKSPPEVLFHNRAYMPDAAVAIHWAPRWVQVADPCDLPTEYDVLVVGRAGLLPGHVGGQVSTANGQPGPVSAMHDPDRVKFAILEQMPLGNTLHLIDALRNGQQIQ